MRRQKLSSRLGAEGLRCLKDREMDRLPGMACDDWRGDDDDDNDDDDHYHRRG